MCKGKWFHTWGNWEVIDEKAFTNSFRGIQRVVVTERRICEVCNKTHIKIQEVEN